MDFYKERYHILAPCLRVFWWLFDGFLMSCITTIATKEVATDHPSFFCTSARDKKMEFRRKDHMHTSVEYSDACLSNLNICMRSINTFLTLLEAYLCCAMTDSSHACSITKTTTWLNPKFESVRLQFSCHLFMLAGGEPDKSFHCFCWGGVGWGGAWGSGVG